MFHICSAARSQMWEGLWAPMLPLRHPAWPSGRPVLRRRSRSVGDSERGRSRRRQKDRRLRGFPGLREGGTTAQIGWRDSDKHEVRIPPRPAQRLLFRLEKSVDDNRVPFERRPAGTSCSFTASYGGTGVDGQERAVRERHFAAVRDPARIHRAMAGAQSLAGRTNMPPRPAIGTAPAAGPVNGNARENGLFHGATHWSEQKQK